MPVTRARRMFEERSWCSALLASYQRATIKHGQILPVKIDSVDHCRNELQCLNCITLCLIGYTLIAYSCSFCHESFEQPIYQPSLGMASSHYYIFRQISTKQVLGSLTPNLTKTALRQIKDITLRPPYIRRDLWAPLVVVCNNTPETLHHTHTIFCNPGTAEPTASELKELRGKTQAQRKALRCDEIASKVEHLCRIYIYLEAKLGREAMPPLKLFWEREAFKDLVKEKGLEWPSFVSHDKLVLRKGITIKTPECLPHSTPLTLGTTSQQPVV